MLIGLQDIFPTRIFKYKLESQEEIKSKYLQDMIDAYEEDKYDIPEGWVTDKVSTSFNSENNQIIKDTPDEYGEIFDKLFDREWKGNFQFWHSVYKNGESQEVHNHLPAMWSGIHFLKFDKKEHKPPIFFDPSRLAKSFNVVYHQGEDKFIPDVEEGDLIIFPSYLEHCVPAGYYDTHRITVAVNLKISYVANQQ